MPEVVPPPGMLDLVTLIQPLVAGLERGEALVHVGVVVVDELPHRVHQVRVLAGAGVPAAALGRVFPANGQSQRHYRDEICPKSV